MYHAGSSPVKNLRITDHFCILTEAAEQIGVDRVTIRRWIAAGQLPAQEVGGVVLIEKAVIAQIKKDRQKSRTK